ncbi:hypothetical protein [Vibrio sp. WXL210]|uniref:hypothetical protein n=1 Tax=Vibrio sp. WXL210 TaxID=3450709 RepID=UPI003EC53C72
MIGLALGFLLVMPLAVLFHELGHVTPQLIAGHSAEIRLGSGSDLKEFRAGKLKISIAPLSMNIGFASIKRDVSKNLQIASLLMGPIVSLVLCATLYMISRHELPYLVHYLVNFGLYFALFQFLFTSVPIYYPSFFGAYEGMPSDGRQVLELLGLMEGQ